MRKQKRGYKEPRLCDFNQVKLSVPRHKVIKLLFKKSYLDFDELIFLKGLFWKVEAAENKILHLKSLVEKALLKSYSGKT